METENPPDLQPTAVGNGISMGHGTSEVTDLLLRILSKLTVYQSLPETPRLVLAVRDDVSMLDACCLLLPTSSSAIIEVLDTGSNTRAESPSSKSSKLLELAANRPDEDFLFARALEQESARVTSAVASDTEIVDPVADFLSVHDVLFFLKKIMDNEPVQEMTVRDWILSKNQIAEDEEWSRFCETSTLVTRTSINLSQGIGHNQVISGSTMNLSSSNLLSPGETSRSLGSKSGGSCLQAVNELLARPWQTYLPLTVSTEKGISAVFGYTTLKQLMAHVAMNCSDRKLESFFSAPVVYDSLRLDAETNLNFCAFLDYDEATVQDAIEVMASSSLSLMVSGKVQVFHRLIIPSDICDILSQRLRSSIGENRLKDCFPEQLFLVEENCIHDSDFPIPLSTLLQKLLMSKADAVVILSDDDVPIGIVSCRDVWAYVMQGGEQ
jgi:hypothetical protein